MNLKPRPGSEKPAPGQRVLAWWPGETNPEVVTNPGHTAWFSESSTHIYNDDPEFWIPTPTRADLDFSQQEDKDEDWEPTRAEPVTLTNQEVFNLAWNAFVVMGIKPVEPPENPYGFPPGVCALGAVVSAKPFYPLSIPGVSAAFEADLEHLIKRSFDITVQPADWWLRNLEIMAQKHGLDVPYARPA